MTTAFTTDYLNKKATANGTTEDQEKQTYLKKWKRLMWVMSPLKINND